MRWLGKGIRPATEACSGTISSAKSPLTASEADTYFYPGYWLLNFIICCSVRRELHCPPIQLLADILVKVFYTFRSWNTLFHIESKCKTFQEQQGVRYFLKVIKHRSSVPQSTWVDHSTYSPPFQSERHPCDMYWSLSLQTAAFLKSLRNPAIEKPDIVIQTAERMSSVQDLYIICFKTNFRCWRLITGHICEFIVSFTTHDDHNESFDCFTKKAI